MDKYDYRGIPTAMCICGSTMFDATIQFDESDYTINWYWLDGKCHECGSLVTLCTEIDHPDFNNSYI